MVIFIKRFKMSTIALCFLCIFLFYASIIESHVLILREYDEEPLLLNQAERSSVKIKPKNAIISLNSHYKPKKIHHMKKATLQLGRPIYNLDNFERSDNKLRSRIAELERLKDDSIAYDYIDVKDLIRSKDAPENVLGKSVKDLVILSVKPIYIEKCKEDDCGDRKAFRKYDDRVDWKHGRNQLRYIKRFEIVDNRHKSKPKYVSSEEYRPKKKKANKRKKKLRDSYETEENSSKKLSRKKKKHNSEDSREIKRKPTKKFVDFSSASLEAYNDESVSFEDFPKIKKKKIKKKKNYGTSEETNRQTIDAPEDYFMQGNKIYYSKDRKKKKRHDFDERRRLPYFLPKRYHWDPEEIHDLGYYWFNGPKGAYPSPQQL